MFKLRIHSVLSLLILLLILPYNLQFIESYGNKRSISQENENNNSVIKSEPLNKHNVNFNTKYQDKNDKKVVSAERINLFDEELTIYQKESINRTLGINETIVLGKQNATNSINGTVKLSSLWNETIPNGNAESLSNPWELEGVEEYAYCNRSTENFSKGEGAWMFNITDYPQLWAKWKISNLNQTISAYANASFSFLLLNQTGLDSNGTSSQITLSLIFDTASVTFFLWRQSPFPIGTPTDREDIRVDSNYLYYFINSTWDGVWHNLSVVDLVSLIETYCNTSVSRLYQIEIACGSFPSPFSSLFFIDEFKCNMSVQPEDVGLELYLDNEPPSLFTGSTFPIILNFNTVNWGTTLLQFIVNQGNNTVQGIIDLEIFISTSLSFESNFSISEPGYLYANISFFTFETSSSIKKLILNVPTDWDQLTLYNEGVIFLEKVTESCYIADIVNENVTGYLLTAITPNYIEEIQCDASYPLQGDYVNITVSMKYVVQGPILLLLKNPQNTVLLQTETICFVSGIALFSNLKIPLEAPKGNVSIEVYWISTSEAGIGIIELFIPTDVGEIITSDWIEAFQYEKIRINGTILDHHTNTSIENGNITILFESWSQSFQFDKNFDILIGPIISSPGNKNLVISAVIGGYIVPNKEVEITVKQSPILVKQKTNSLGDEYYELHLNVTNSEYTPIPSLSIKVSHNDTLISAGFTDDFGQSIIHFSLPPNFILNTFEYRIQIIWGVQILWENTSYILLSELIQYNEATIDEIIQPQTVLCNETVIVHTNVSYPFEGRYWYIFSPFPSNEIKSVQLLHESETINVRLEQDKLFWELPNNFSSELDELVFQVGGPTVLIKHGEYNGTTWPKIDLNITSRLKFYSVRIEIPLTVLEKTVTDWFAFDILGRNITQDINITKKTSSLLSIHIGTINANSTKSLVLTGVPVPIEVELDSLPETIDCNESLHIQINVTSLVSVPFGLIEFNMLNQGIQNISLLTTNLTEHKYLLTASFGPFPYNTSAKYRILVWDVNGWFYHSSYFFLNVTDSINPKAVLNIKSMEDNTFLFSANCWEEHTFESGIDQVLLLILNDNENRTEVLSPSNDSSQEWIIEIKLYEESKIRLQVRDKAGNQIFLPQNDDYLILKPQNGFNMNLQDVVFLSALVTLGTKGLFSILSFWRKKETIRLD